MSIIISLEPYRIDVKKDGHAPRRASGTQAVSPIFARLTLLETYILTDAGIHYSGHYVLYPQSYHREPF